MQLNIHDNKTYLKLLNNNYQLYVLKFDLHQLIIHQYNLVYKKKLNVTLKNQMLNIRITKKMITKNK